VGRRDQASGVLFRNSAKEVSCLENTRLNSGGKSASSIALGWQIVQTSVFDAIEVADACHLRATKACCQLRGRGILLCCNYEQSGDKSRAADGAAAAL
jgi:hypothetical protein